MLLNNKLIILEFYNFTHVILFALMNNYTEQKFVILGQRDFRPCLIVLCRRSFAKHGT